MQFLPDYTLRSSIPKLEAEFKIEFKGPGFYLLKTDTLLILPLPPNDYSLDTIWRQTQPDGTVWEVIVWNQPIQNLVISMITTAPARLDTR